jgi:hypothetical protein
MVAMFFLDACGGASARVIGETFHERSGAPPTLVTSVTLVRLQSEDLTAPRLVAIGGTDNDTFLGRQRTRIHLALERSFGSLPERYHYLVFGTRRALFEGGTAEDASIVDDHIGQLTDVSATKATPDLLSFDSGGLHIGASWLFAVQQDDRTIPWRRQRGGDEQCFPMSQDSEDCFDVESFTSLLFTQIADDAEASATKIPGIRVASSLLHAVPQVVHRTMESGPIRRARGFGFVYELRLVHPLGTLQVFVPINVLFTSDIKEYRVFIDPVDLEAQSSEAIAGVRVKGSFGVNLLEGTVRDAIVDGIKKVKLSSPVRGVLLVDFLLTAINGTVGPPPLKGASLTLFPKYEVVLMPESVDPTARPSTIWQRDSGSDLVAKRTMKIVFLE